MALTQLCTSATRLADARDILAVGFQQHFLRGISGQMEMQPVFDENSRVTACLARLTATHEDKQTVPSVDLQIRQTVQVRLSIDIHTENIPLVQPYAVDEKGRAIGIIDSEHQR